MERLSSAQAAGGVGIIAQRTAAAGAREEGRLESPPVMGEYLRFLRTHPVWWLAPIALYLGVLLWLAAQLVRTPENPFAYTPY